MTSLAVKALIVLLATAAGASGSWAAYKWYLASKVQIDLGYHPVGLPGGTVRRMGMDFPRFSEPMDAEARQSNEIMATWEAISESSQLNKVAAMWTAISVGLAALSTIVSVLAL